MPVDGETLKALLRAALDARANAYAPYSNYSVGAAVLTDTGKVVVGVNVENASYPLTICAERVALTSYVAQGREGSIVAIAVATQDGGSPCGACRQVMAELAKADCPVYAVSPDMSYRCWTVQELLPHAFSLKSD